MKADADRLLKSLGDDAYRAAADLTWREDMGLLDAADPGHWSRVTQEIGRRLSRTDVNVGPPVTHLAAGGWSSTVLSQAA